MTFQGHAQQLFMPDLPSDRNLTLSCYVKTDKVTATSSGGGAGMYFNFYKKDGTHLSQPVQPNKVTGTNDWQRISFSTTAPAGTYEVRVYFGLRDATGTCLVRLYAAGNRRKHGATATCWRTAPLTPLIFGRPGTTLPLKMPTQETAASKLQAAQT